MQQALLSAKPKLGCSCQLKQGFSPVRRENIVLYFLLCLFLAIFFLFLPNLLHKLSRALDISVRYQMQWPATLECA